MSIPHELNLKKSKSIPKIIYHYRPLDAFLSIIKSNEIYLTTTKYMNDYLESKWIMKIVEKIENKRTIFDSYFIKIAKRIISRYREGIYITCFSKHKDKLSQWRAYTQDGSGVSIGFDANVLQPNENSDNKELALSLNEVVYDVEEQSKILSSITDYYYDSIKNTEHTKENTKNFSWFEQVRLNDVLADKSNYKNPRNFYTSKYAQALIVLSYLFKNKAFHEEHEYRLCYSPNFNFLNPIETSFCGIARGDLSFRTSDNKISPYYPLSFSENKKFIKEIVLGPKCQTNISTFRMLLNEIGFSHVKVTKSEASYR